MNAQNEVLKSAVKKAVLSALAGYLVPPRRVIKAINDAIDAAAVQPAEQKAQPDTAEQDVWIAYNSVDDDEPVMFFTELPGKELKERFVLKHYKCRLATPSPAPSEQDKADAELLDFLEQMQNVPGKQCSMLGFTIIEPSRNGWTTAHEFGNTEHETLREAIDAARASQGEAK